MAAHQSFSGTKAAPPRRRSLMKDRAYQSLKRLILDEVLEPGAFLSERQLAARLKMSKTPVKAALERLESEGFLGVSPQQGIVVHDLSLDEIADQFEIRVVLEAYIVRRLAGRITSDQVAEVRANLEAQAASAKNNNVAASVRLDAEFHLLWSEFLGNEEIQTVLHRLRDKIHRVITRVNSRNPHRLQESYIEHVRIADAIITGDGERAAQFVEEHLRYGQQFLLAPRGV